MRWRYLVYTFQFCAEAVVFFENNIETSKKSRICAICGVRERHCRENMFFARFPLDENRCKLWVKAVGNEDLLHIPIEKLHDNKYVCVKHFVKRDFTKTGTRLKKRAVPQLNLTTAPLTEDQLASFPLHIAQETSHGSQATQDHLLQATESKLPKPTESKLPKPTESSVQVYKPTESSIQVFTPTGSKVLKLSESGVQVQPETSVQEHAIDTEISYEEGYLDTFEDIDAGHEIEEQPTEEGPFSWQKYKEEVVALDENVAAEDDVKFCGEAQLVPDVSEPVTQTQEEYSCNVCKEKITGFRYVCVVCPDWDLCGACEARAHHSDHYVLRVPPGKPHSETAWVIATLRQMLASREEPDLTLVKDEVKSEDPLADMDIPVESRAEDTDDSTQETRDPDTASIEDIDERIDTDITSDFPSTPHKRNTTTPTEAVPSKKRKHVILKAVPIQRKDITGNVVILGKHMPDNSQNIAAMRTVQKEVQISMDNLKMHIPQLDTREVTMWDDTRTQNITATIPVQKESGKVILWDDFKKQIPSPNTVLDDNTTATTIAVQKQKVQKETKKVIISLDDLKRMGVDKSQKLTIIAAPVKKKISQLESDELILQKGVISLKKPTHIVDGQKITVTAGPAKKTSHIGTDKVILVNKKIVTLEEPKRVTVSEKRPESGEVVILDDTVSNIVQPTESSNVVQVVKASDGNMILKAVEIPRQLRVNMTQLSNEDIQNATQPSTSKR